MVDERQPKESTSFPLPKDGHNQPADENANSNSIDYKQHSQTGTYFFAKVRINLSLELLLLHFTWPHSCS